MNNMQKSSSVKESSAPVFYFLSKWEAKYSSDVQKNSEGHLSEKSLQEWKEAGARCARELSPLLNS